MELFFPPDPQWGPITPKEAHCHGDGQFKLIMAAFESLAKDEFGLSDARFLREYAQRGQDTLDLLMESRPTLQPSQVGHEAFHLRICEAFFTARHKPFPWHRLASSYPLSSTDRPLSKDYAGYYYMRALAAARRPRQPSLTESEQVCLGSDDSNQESLGGHELLRQLALYDRYPTQRWDPAIHGNTDPFRWDEEFDDEPMAVAPAPAAPSAPQVQQESVRVGPVNQPRPPLLPQAHHDPARWDPSIFGPVEPFYWGDEPVGVPWPPSPVQTPEVADSLSSGPTLVPDSDSDSNSQATASQVGPEWVAFFQSILPPSTGDFEYESDGYDPRHDVDVTVYENAPPLFDHVAEAPPPSLPPSFHPDAAVDSSDDESSVTTGYDGRHERISWGDVVRQRSSELGLRMWERGLERMENMDSIARLYQAPAPIVAVDHECVLGHWASTLSLDGDAKPWTFEVPDLETVLSFCGKDLERFKEAVDDRGILTHFPAVQLWLEFNRSRWTGIVKSVTMCFGPAVCEDGRVPREAMDHVLDCFLAVKMHYQSGSPPLGWVLGDGAYCSPASSLLGRIVEAYTLHRQPPRVQYCTIQRKVAFTVQHSWETSENLLQMVREVAVLFVRLTHGQSGKRRLDALITLFTRAYRETVEAAMVTLPPGERRVFESTYGHVRIAAMLEARLRVEVNAILHRNEP